MYYASNSSNYSLCSEQRSKTISHDLKTIYAADTKEMAEQNLLLLDEKWGSKYPIVLKSWQKSGIIYQLILSIQSLYGGLFIEPIRLKGFIAKYASIQNRKAHLLLRMRYLN